ncbi:hypothetical protein PUN28_000214 [Cardiocondyla obscurior]|uniref:Uncharacterized protein n=1 Tax=Cardiocondyla obscurior TaxID=286306 RepID=A0AAW2GYJ9_9HYME
MTVDFPGNRGNMYFKGLVDLFASIVDKLTRHDTLFLGRGGFLQMRKRINIYINIYIYIYYILYLPLIYRKFYIPFDGRKSGSSFR